jgi:hypothetical protein
MFMDLLVLADSTGAVDMTPEAISRRTNVPVEEVVKYVKELCQPDEKSRSRIEEGKRLVLLDSNRDWGWQIVNYAHYRKITDEEARRSYFRDAQRKHRKKDVKDKPLTTFDRLGQGLTPASASASASEKRGSAEGGNPKAVKFPNGLPDSEWIEQLCNDPAYQGIEVKREHGKMVNWCKVKGATPTRRRFINWLNRAEKPMTGKPDETRWKDIT